MKLIILTIFSLPLAQAFARSPGTYFQVKNDLQNFSQRNLVSLLNDFVKASAPSRMVGQPGHESAVTWIREQIKKFDPKNSGSLSIKTFDPDINEARRFYQSDFDQKVEGKIPSSDPDYMKWQTFTSSMQLYANKLKDVQGKNIVWEKNGLNAEKVLVVTAHYDTISHDTNTLLIREKDPMPGANFNASGVTVALALIRALASIDLNYSVQVVFLDWQGIGFLGSYQHAKELKAQGKSIIGVINLEMLGQDSSFFDKSKKLGNMKVYGAQSPESEKWLKKLTAHGENITHKVSFAIDSKDFENSDNFRYSQQGFLTATFTQNWEEDFNPKFYQTTQDTPETLNHETLYYGYQYVGGSVLSTLLDITK